MSLCVQVDGAKQFKLSDFNNSDTHGYDHISGEAKTLELAAELAILIDLMFAASQHSLLIVLQGMDTSGKDGLIRHLLSYMNPQSATVTPFKAPTPEELSHDFLWRVHKRTPERGHVAIFNRSHYEDVLIARVHKHISDEVINRRYDQINAFEQMLVDSNTIVLKLCLFISKEEQHARLCAREQEPSKFWKLSVGDWQEREYWHKYEEAYELAINRCSSKHIPWNIVAANHKWFRTLAATEAIVHAMRPYMSTWSTALEELGQRALAEIRAYRNSTEKLSQ